MLISQHFYVIKKRKSYNFTKKLSTNEPGSLISITAAPQHPQCLTRHDLPIWHKVPTVNLYDHNQTIIL